MKCYMKNCVNNNEWACAYREDCDYCSKDCKHYYKCIDCDYYMDESVEEEFMEGTNKDKFKMELTWHSCKLYPPEEDYNPCLFVTNGTSVVLAEYRKGYGFFFQEKLINDENMWWADLEQTVQGTSEFKEYNYG